MASSKNSVPEAKEALNRFKMEAASDDGVCFIETKTDFYILSVVCFPSCKNGRKPQN